jgi:hypothetical protein
VVNYQPPLSPVCLTFRRTVVMSVREWQTDKRRNTVRIETVAKVQESERQAVASFPLVLHVKNAYRMYRQECTYLMVFGTAEVVRRSASLLNSQMRHIH